MTRLYCRQPNRLHLMFSALLISLTLLAGCEQESTSAINADLANKNKIVPKQAVDFTLPDLAGKPHGLAEYLDKGPVMLVFFTTWCPYCKKEIPMLKQVYRQYGSKGLQLVAINAGLADSLENAKQYALQHRLPYVVLYDADGTISGQYGVRAVPKIVYIQQDGDIRHTAQHVDKHAIDDLLGIRQ